MSPSFPPLPADLVEHVHGGVSLLTGTCSADLVPESVRSAGIRVWSCACKLTVFLPQATADIAVANLRSNPRIAITASQVETHRTVQMKGRVLAIRAANEEEDHPLVLRYGAAFRRALDFVGIPEGVTSGLAQWPAWAVDVEIEHVFAQTPGPLAGLRMPLVTGTALP